MAADINVVALEKGKGHGKSVYIWLFDDAHKPDVMLSLGRAASNPELDFTWYDAAVMSQKVRQATPVTAHPRRGG